VQALVTPGIDYSFPAPASMTEPSRTETLLIERIRKGEADAWQDLIDRYEGRLLAFAESRVGRRSAAEDIVQEAFVGFLTSLPNYDGRRSLESYLFSICAYKLTDHLRREGRRPALPFSVRDGSQTPWDIPAPSSGTSPAARTGTSLAQSPSTIARSAERRTLEEKAIAQAIGDQVQHLRSRGDWTKLQCVELLFLGGWANKDVATRLEISEQQVANFKFDFLARLRKIIRQQGLSSDVFPELYEGA
jgi:RNA polymerase sigma-70 factor (ECF subfamily)